MTRKFYDEFSLLRKQVANAIREELEIDGCCKSYEGTWELLLSYPTYFEDKAAEAAPDFYSIRLHCYVLGPGRHYEWNGKSWDEALQKCKADVDEWCAI